MLWQRRRLSKRTHLFLATVANLQHRRNPGTAAIPEQGWARLATEAQRYFATGSQRTAMSGWERCKPEPFRFRERRTRGEHGHPDLGKKSVQHLSRLNGDSSHFA